MKSDREEDVRLLRSQLQKEKQAKMNFDENHCKDFQFEEKVSENLVKQLEKLQIRCASLKQDLQVCTEVNLLKLFGAYLSALLSQVNGARRL